MERLLFASVIVSWKYNPPNAPQKPMGGVMGCFIHSYIESVVALLMQIQPQLCTERCEANTLMGMKACSKEAFREVVEFADYFTSYVLNCGSTVISIY